MKRLLAEIRKPVFWFILIAFSVLVFFYFRQHLPAAFSGINSFPGTNSLSYERILFLLIIILGGFTSGLTAGFIYMVLSAAAMLPVIFISSGSGTNAVFEVILVIIAGLGFNLWFEERRLDARRQKESQLKFAAVQLELQENIKTVRDNEKRLAVLHSVTAAINQFSNLDSILNTAADKVMEALGVDGVLIYLINDIKNELQLKQYRGISEEFSNKINHLKTEDSLKEFLTLPENPQNIQDSPQNTALTAENQQNKVIISHFSVPLTAQEKVVGTLCALSYSARQLTRDEEQLLVLIGVELGLAVERTALSDEKERAGKRFKELFEKAHDAIWIQDLDGKILDANQAMSDFTGYRLERLIGGDVIRSLNPHALELAREVRYKLLNGINVEQPYEQRITRRDGTEAIIMLTTTVIKEEGKPVVFQHISRDVTREKKLAENLRLYAQQITRTQEDERKRIARELHDDSIQSLIILLRSIDELISIQPKRSKMVRSLEDLHAEVDKVISQVRRFTQDLRPPTLDYLGLVPALRELISQFEHQSNIKTEIKISGKEIKFAPEAEMLIYRIIQEALNNVWRHSAALTASVSIDFGKDGTTIEVKDDGKGFVIGEDLRFVEAGKIGLAGMQERADLLGGNLSIQSNVGRGTLVTLLVPYDRWKKEVTA
jgi:two-component system, NarL family, sensor histidine kinase DegS